MSFVKKEVDDDSDSPSYKVMKTHMTNEEFKDRVKAICGPKPKGPCVRVPTDRGYFPPVPTKEQFAAAVSGEKTIWNSDGTDGPVLICVPPQEAA